ncbi:autophagy-related protein [Cytidiella melzeri]|nr:autophagy-related protein [Cytidiella melzeri]
MNATNYPVITIDLVLDRRNTRDVLTAVLHSILFHRLFGTVKPTTFEILDVTMPGLDDAEIKQLVDSRVDAFWKAMEGGAQKRGQISVTFSEKRPRKTWFLIGEEEVPWEQWYLTINAEIRQPVTERDRHAFDSELASALTKSLQTMLTYTSSERGRSVVPLITNALSISPFPYKIVVKVGGTEVGG